MKTYLRGTISFIETDKPRYNPGQSVLINVYIMNPELLPKNVPVKLFLMDSRGSRVFQDSLHQLYIYIHVIYL